MHLLICLSISLLINSGSVLCCWHFLRIFGCLCICHCNLNWDPIHLLICRQHTLVPPFIASFKCVFARTWPTRQDTSLPHLHSSQCVWLNEKDCLHKVLHVYSCLIVFTQQKRKVHLRNWLCFTYFYNVLLFGVFFFSPLNVGLHV